MKVRNHAPTCVNPDTASKLIQRGWGEPLPLPEPEIIKEISYDSEKYYEEFGPGSPLIYLNSSKPVLDFDNCDRYAYWLTEHQKEKIDRYEDYPRYPPWGNQIFPLVDFCMANGDFVKLALADEFQWSFYKINSEQKPDQEMNPISEKDQIDTHQGGNPNTPEIFRHGVTKFVNPSHESSKVLQNSTSDR